tara:strand:- start:7839 stop:10241 length:2403 start_codon:yes stop_codon:yes gene_type:complete
MNKINRTLIITLFLISNIYSQVSINGTPKSVIWDMNNEITNITLPEVDHDFLQLQDLEEKDKNVPYRFGNPFDVNFNLNNSGTWENIDNGRLWRLSITSKNAYSINLLYDKFVIPEGAELYVYDKDKSTILGAFTNLNNKSYETFATSPTKGDVTIIEYFEPYNVEFNGTIQIGRVVHAYKDVFYPEESRDYGDSGSCNNNVNCPEFIDWEAEVRSVAMILSGGGFRLCTGSLVNNVRQDLTPYFLTANHCLGGESNWIFMFNYESSGCNNQNGPTFMTVQGSTLLDNSASSDYAILRLEEEIPDTYEVHYAGWDASGTTPSTPVGIHHPSGDIKKISFDYNNASNAGNYWDVNNWEDGTTEPGSSGSPLFDGNTHRIVGQLYGGTASCTSITYDTYGKVSSSWNLGLKDYLDPDNTGTTILDGMDAIDLPDPELTYDTQELTFDMNTNESQSDIVNIFNTGELDSELNYNISSSPFNVIGDGPDDGDYFWTDSDIDNNTNYEWIDISDIGTIYTFPTNDQAGATLSLDFNFPFYIDDFSNNQYNELFINPNGWVGFDNDVDSWDNTGIPSNQINGAAIFGLWDDLNPVNDNCNQYCSGNVYYHSNAERFVIWFNEVAHWWTYFENTFYDFQIVIYPSGKIDINYRNIDGNYDASVGIQKNSNIGSQVIFGSDGLSNNFNITFESAPKWLSVNPEQGTLYDNESQSIIVTCSSDDNDGTLYAYMNVASNGGSVSIPVTMNVNGSTLGDTNDDDNINVLDVIIMVNMILGDAEVNLNTGDMNGDGLINVSDVVLLINNILG